MPRVMLCAVAEKRYDARDKSAVARRRLLLINSCGVPALICYKDSVAERHRRVAAACAVMMFTRAEHYTFAR